MLNTLFLSVLNRSIVSGFVILAVLLVRLFLKKAPGIFSYVLWAVVLLRLLCPFTFESAFGLLPAGKAPALKDIMYQADTQLHTGIYRVDRLASLLLPAPGQLTDSAHSQQAWISQQTLVFAGSMVWVAGMAAMLIYGLIQFVKLKKKLIGAAPFKDRIYFADHIASPFVMGFIRPVVYLPSSIAESEQGFIIAHELCHIKRLDHITRIFAFIALAIHWFNPLAWLAFLLSGKDMELSCDEAVMKNMPIDIRAEYAQSLLRFASGRRFISATPLAFGEGDTKGRIKNVMKYKKPMLWVSALAAVTVICVAAGLMSSPEAEVISLEAEIMQPETEAMPAEASLAEKIWKNRTEYVGNNAAVGAIISELGLPEKLEYAGFMLDTGQQPYGITVNCKTDTETGNFYRETQNQMLLQKNAIILFALIGNADVVHFNIDDGKEPFPVSFYRESAQAIMEEEDLFGKTETVEDLEKFMKEIPAGLSGSGEHTDSEEAAEEYMTEAEFLNHPEGVKFQAAAYRAAKAYLSGDSQKLEECISENCTVDTTLDLFKDINYMILKWNLDAIKAEDRILASYEFLLEGEDSVSYVSMELVKIEDEWKVDFIGLEK